MILLGCRGKHTSYREQSTTAKSKDKFIQANFNQRTTVFFVRSKS